MGAEMSSRDKKHCPRIFEFQNVSSTASTLMEGDDSQLCAQSVWQANIHGFSHITISYSTRKYAEVNVDQ